MFSPIIFRHRFGVRSQLLWCWCFGTFVSREDLTMGFATVWWLENVPKKNLPNGGLFHIFMVIYHGRIGKESPTIPIDIPKSSKYLMGIDVWNSWKKLLLSRCFGVQTLTYKVSGCKGFVCFLGHGEKTAHPFVVRMTGICLAGLCFWWGVSGPKNTQPFWVFFKRGSTCFFQFAEVFVSWMILSSLEVGWVL